MTFTVRHKQLDASVYSKIYNNEKLQLKILRNTLEVLNLYHRYIQKVNYFNDKYFDGLIEDYDINELIFAIFIFLTNEIYMKTEMGRLQ